jgi:hypothetical protein
VPPLSHLSIVDLVDCIAPRIHRPDKIPCGTYPSRPASPPCPLNRQASPQMQGTERRSIHCTSEMPRESKERGGGASNAPASCPAEAVPLLLPFAGKSGRRRCLPHRAGRGRGLAVLLRDCLGYAGPPGRLPPRAALGAPPSSALWKPGRRKGLEPSTGELDMDGGGAVAPVASTGEKDMDRAGRTV